MGVFLARTFRVVLGLLLCGVGGLGAIALMVVTIQQAWGWIFLVGPVSILVAVLLIRLGTKLLAA